MKTCKFPHHDAVLTAFILEDSPEGDKVVAEDLQYAVEDTAVRLGNGLTYIATHFAKYLLSDHHQPIPVPVEFYKGKPLSEWYKDPDEQAF
jgi:hypothetical protein